MSGGPFACEWDYVVLCLICLRGPGSGGESVSLGYLILSLRRDGMGD